MTSKLTREQLHERARENVKALKMASRQHAFESAREEILADLQLAELALATMDSEPVTEVLSSRPGNDTSTIDRALPVGTTLYRHAQQPVVDADDNFYSWFGREWQENYQHNQYTTAAKQMLGVMAESAWKAGRRAAMLAVAPHDTHALNSLQSVDSVAGKWIPVSERMPEIGDIVLTAMGGVVNVGETECSAANCRFFTSVISGRELPATHWMPLPAAPQEVK